MALSMVNPIIKATFESKNEDFCHKSENVDRVVYEQCIPIQRNLEIDKIKLLFTMS